MLDRRLETVGLEAAVIGSLMYHACSDNGFANQLIDRWRLVPDDFENPVARYAYETMQQLHSEGIAPAFMALKQRMVLDHEKWSQLVNLLSKGHLVYYASMGDDIRSQAGYARLIRAIEHLKSMGCAGENIQEALKFLREEIDEIQHRETPVDAELSMTDDTLRIVEDLQNGVVPETITTGSRDLTRTLSGYRRGQLIIMAGRPSMGKSMVAQSLGLQIAKQGHGVLMFALEMSCDEHIYRALSDLSYTSNNRLEYRDIQAGDISDNGRDMIARAANDLNSMPFTICDRPGLKLDAIQSRVRAQKKSMEKAGKSLDVVIVDHIGLVRDTGRYRDNRNNQIGEITSGLLRIAKEMDVAVVGVCQLNRQTENRENKRPQLSDLRDSGNIEQDANAVVFVYREAYYLERMPFRDDNEKYDRDQMLARSRNKIEMIVAKNRQGPTTTIEMFCDPGCNVIRDLEANNGTQHF